MKAKRINSTEMLSAFEWRTEPDQIGGIREWTNYYCNNKTISFIGSKVWLYGAKAWNHGDINIKLSNNDDVYINVNVNTQNDDRIDFDLLFESELMPFNFYEMILTALKDACINCIYYLTVPPQQTPNPNPSQTPIPNSDLDYIDKIFEGAFENNIIIESDSQIQQISGCTFKDISLGRSNYFLRIQKEILFFDNTFNYSDLSHNFQMPIWMNYNGNLIVDNCKFINCMHRSDSTGHSDGNVFYSASNTVVNISFTNCHFSNCGNIIDRPIFGLFSSDSKINIDNCFFNFDDASNSSKIILSNTESVVINNCFFQNAGSIQIDIFKNNEGVFQFTNNNCISNQQTIFIARTLMNKPIITGNTIQNCNLEESTYLFEIIHRINEIDLINNSFAHNRVSNGTNYGASLSCFFQNINDEQITLKFINCYFINNENAKTKSICNNGGAFQYGYSQTLMSTAIVFENCEFRRNRCLYGKGGAISISTNQNLTLNNCIFEDNTDSQGAVIHFLGQAINHYEPDVTIDESQIDCICIKDCQFIGYKDMSAILVEEDIIKVHSICILSCNFTNIGNSSLNLIDASSDIFLLENINVEYITCKSIQLKVGQKLDLAYTRFNSCAFSDDFGIQLTGSEDSTISISECDFLDCKASKYSIKILNGIHEVSSCSFNFTNIENSCSGLESNSASSVKISSCIFLNNYNRADGSLYINSRTIGNVVLNDITFDNCLGDGYNSINAVFENINNNDQDLIIQDLVLRNLFSNPSLYAYQIKANKNIKLSHCIFENCSSFNSQGGGSSSCLNPLSKIFFEYCNWIDNYCSECGGALQLGNSAETNQLILSFEYCNFTQNRALKLGDALMIQTQADVFIIHCIFSKNVAGHSQSSRLLDEDGLGGAIYINPGFQTPPNTKPEYAINNCQFIENQAIDGHAIVIRIGIDEAVSFDKNIFQDNGINGSSIVTDIEINLDDSTFNITDEDKPLSNPIQFEGIPTYAKHLTYKNQIIFESNDEAHFYNCTFVNCMFTLNKGHQYVITVHCSQFSFENCTIKFKNAENACGGILIDCYCNATITDSYFLNCNVYDYDGSAGICYEPIGGDSLIEQMIFINNMFEGMEGTNSRCFKIKIKYEYISHPLSDITIKNCKNGGYTGVFNFIESSGSISNTYEFDNWNFIDNSCNSLLSGGCGLFISFISDNNEFNPYCIFRNSSWIKNGAIYAPDILNDIMVHNGAGGGLQFGFIEMSVKFQFTFETCQFVENRAEKEGGALAIQTIKSCKIKNCTFKGNHAQTHGGALYIDPDFDNPEI